MVQPFVSLISQKEKSSFLHKKLTHLDNFPRVRIHVERVIGRWKNFKILQTVIPVSQVNMLDGVVTVCGALTNLCKSVVSK